MTSRAALMGGFSMSKNLMDSKGDSLLAGMGTQYPRNIAPPLGEGLGWGQFHANFH